MNANPKIHARTRGKPLAESGPNSLIFWAGTGFLLLFLLIAPFRTGLFNGYLLQYEHDLYSSVAWTSLFFLVVSVYWIFRRTYAGVRDLLSLLVWGLPLSYLLSQTAAVSPYSNGKQLALYAMYAMFFSMGAYFARSRGGSQIIQAGIMISGYLVVAYGFLNLFGNAYFQDAVMNDPADGLRLTSVFQYANAYAAYLIALLLGCLYFCMSSRKWYIVALNAAMLVPLAVSFLLTLSRGGMVVLPLILLAVLPFLSVVRQLSFFVYLAVSFAASFLVIDPIKAVGTDMLKRMAESKAKNGGKALTVGLSDPESLKGWTLLVLALLAAAAIVWLFQWLAVPRLQKQLAKFSDRKGSSLLLPVVLLALGAIGLILLSQGSVLDKLLPQAIQQRIESINFRQHSVLERLMMYRNSLGIFADRPLLGGGGGAWEALYTQYQGSPYISRQTHDYFLEYLDETGLVGLLFMAALLVLAIYFYVKNVFIQKKGELDQTLLFYLVAVSILTHSLLDFEMSYGYIAALVFLSLGGMTSGITSGLDETSGRFTGWMSKRAVSMAIPAVLSLIAAAVIITSLYNLRANTLFNRSIDLFRANRPVEEAMAPLDQALKMRPAHPDFVLQKVQILEQVASQTNNAELLGQAAGLLDKLKTEEPYNRTLFEEQYNLAIHNRDLSAALEIVNERLESNRWGLSMFDGKSNWFERAILLNFQLGYDARGQNHPQLQAKYWNDAITVYNTVLERLKELEQLPKEQLHQPFGVTPNMALSIAKIHYISGKYQEAAEVLRPRLSDQWTDETNRSLTRWYLASLRKAGQNDQALYDKFTGSYPEERRQIEGLINARL
jgi:O-antigen ligase